MFAFASPARRRALVCSVTLLAVAGLSVAGCSAPGDAAGETSAEDVESALQKPSKLTIWSWSANVEAGAEEFMKLYPEIDIEVVNVGTGADHYTKLQNAIKAGSGVPDIATMEYTVLPQFALSGDLHDLSVFGFGDLEDEFTASTWNQVKLGDKVYALPRGAGPMALFYNVTVFDRLGIEVPSTWDEYRAAAETIHAADPNAYITADTGDAGYTNSLIWASGGTPYEVDGENISIDFTDEETKTYTEFWNGMLEDGLIASTPAWSNEWYQSFVDGSIATITSGAWMAGNLASGAPDAAGDWRVAPMPTFDGGRSSAENGGGGDAILEQSDNKTVAAAFLKWMNVTDGPAISTKMGFFPAQTAVQESEEWLATKNEFFGGQEINKVFAESARNVVPGWKNLPYYGYAASIFNDTAGTAYAGKTSLQEGLEDWGDDLKTYGEQQGFTIE